MLERSKNAVPWHGIRENSNKGIGPDYEVEDKFIHEKKNKESNSSVFLPFGSFMSQLTCHLHGEDLDHLLGNSSPWHLLPFDFSVS